MLVEVNGTKVLGYVQADEEYEREFLNNNTGYIKYEFNFLEKTECYEFKNGKIGLKENWEDIKNGLEVKEEIASFKELQEYKIKQINKNYEDEVESLIKGIPLTERTTWSIQEEEARRYLQDNNAEIPFLYNLSINRGIDVAILAQKVIEKAKLYATALGRLTGKRQKLEDKILLCTTKEELEVIDV